MVAPSTNNLPPGHGERRLRFGVFELDLAARELRKSGKLVRLQEQPFMVLLALVENAGRVVTREDLRQRIWPADTFVDFDHSLNTAVNKIRDSLGDSASSPLFVETLARRGYRFIAPLNGPAMPDSTLKFSDLSSVAEPGPLHRELEVPVPHRGMVRVLFVLIQVMFITFYLAALSHLHDVDRIATGFLNDWKASTLVSVVLITGAAGIPLRFYLISAVAFDFRKLGANFRRLFPFVLTLDLLWALAPFLLLPQVGMGLAFASTAALLYVPFSERTLVRMVYDES